MDSAKEEKRDSRQVSSSMNVAQEIQLSRDEWCRRHWLDLGGNELEPALRSGAIALLDARWLVEFAGSQSAGKSYFSFCHDEMPRDAPVLSYRQALPKTAFISCDKLISGCMSGRDSANFLPVVVLSYMWLSPTHPDPMGATLRLVAEKCTFELFNFPVMGVFWDYASLYQHPNRALEECRSASQEELFQQGLQCLSTFYSHPHTSCWKVTEFPANYPESYSLPPQVRVASYHERGWPLVESCWSSITAGKTQDICYPRGFDYSEARILPPIHPKRLQEELKRVQFTNEKNDRPLVLKLYRDYFVRRFQTMELIDYCNKDWYNFHVEALAEILADGYAPQLKHLQLAFNRFGAQGCKALARALRQRRTLPSILRLRRTSISKSPSRLLSLSVGGNLEIRDEGLSVLLDVLVHVEAVDISQTNIGLNGCQAFARAAEKAKPSLKLKNLQICGNPFGWKGLKILSSLVVGHLKVVNLKHCEIGNAGCRVLADAAYQYPGESPLERLDLGGRQNIDATGLPDLCRFLRNSPNLQVLRLAVGKQVETNENQEMLRRAACHSQFCLEWTSLHSSRWAGQHWYQNGGVEIENTTIEDTIRWSKNLVSQGKLSTIARSNKDGDESGANTVAPVGDNPFVCRMGNPVDNMMQMDLQELKQVARMMGMSVDQLLITSQMISRRQEEELSGLCAQDRGCGGSMEKGTCGPQS